MSADVAVFKKCEVRCRSSGACKVCVTLNKHFKALKFPVAKSPASGYAHPHTRPCRASTREDLDHTPHATTRDDHTTTRPHTRDRPQLIQLSICLYPLYGPRFPLFPSPRPGLLTSGDPRDQSQKRKGRSHARSHARPVIRTLRASIRNGWILLRHAQSREGVVPRRE